MAITTEKEPTTKQLEQVVAHLFADQNPIGKKSVLDYLRRYDPAATKGLSEDNVGDVERHIELISENVADHIDQKSHDIMLRKVITAMRDDKWDTLTTVALGGSVVGGEESRPQPDDESKPEPAAVTTTTEVNMTEDKTSRIEINPDQFEVNRLFEDKKSYLTNYVEGFVIPIQEGLRKKLESSSRGAENKIKSLTREVNRLKSSGDGGDGGEATFEPQTPEQDANYTLTKERTNMMDAIMAMSEEDPQNVLCTGDPSSGKSEFVKYAAAKHGRPFHSINCAVVREPGHWFGGIRAKGGSTVYEPSQFVRAITMGNCVVRLEEVNRVSPVVSNALYEILDQKNRKTYIDDYGMVEVAEGTVFMGTANVGNQYQGTFDMDEALGDRFTIQMEFTYMEAELLTKLLVGRTGIPEVLASKCATVHQQVVDKTRVVGAGSYDKAITYRQWEASCKLWHKIGNKAFEPTVLNHFNDDGVDSQRSQLLKLFAGVELL
jgi:hypothetical protein